MEGRGVLVKSPYYYKYALLLKGGVWSKMYKKLSTTWFMDDPQVENCPQPKALMSMHNMLVPIDVRWGS